MNFQTISGCKIAWTLFRLAECFENPPSDGIVTFGGLTRRVAGARVSAAR